MRDEEINYEEDMALDRAGLDYEWLRQASLYLKYSILYADLASRRDEAKEELQKIDAMIDLEVRSDFGEFGFEVKPTEPAIKAVILQDDRHITASKEYFSAQREVNILQGAKTALDHKKSALERLSALYLAGYWADPLIKEEARKHYAGSSQDEHRSQLEKNPRIGRNRNNG